MYSSPMTPGGTSSKLAVEHVEAGARERAPDGHRTLLVHVADLVDAAADHGLGGPVFVDEAGAGRMAAPVRRSPGRQGLAAADDAPRAPGELRRRDHAREELEVGRRELDRAEILALAEHRHQPLDAVAVTHDHHVPAGHQGQ